MTFRFSIVALTVAAACAPATPAAPLPKDPAARVTKLADKYVSAFFQRTPEAATRRGLPDANNGGVTDNSLAAIAAWRVREDCWLRELRAIEPAELVGRSEWAT